ncbi:Serine/threonine-protein kinase tbk1 [Bulinus truncatus]|nr:Serine/threonine-protein kinase tbk1 [Bulinus truncatus]
MLPILGKVVARLKGLVRIQESSIQESSIQEPSIQESSIQESSIQILVVQCKLTGKVVAVKVFHDYISQKADDIRELELLRQLQHKNIIRLIGIEKMAPNKNVLIMEYCEGGSLHHMLDQPLYYYGLSEEEFLLVLKHVSDGIQYLRQKSVIHRDIKPGNIMRYITSDGQSIYKLTDFGAARNLNEDESFQSLYGTEEYLHPGIYERAVLKLPTQQCFDAKVDLWSLGVTFFHTATGQLPFQPYGGRNNRLKMFEIITQKESGVISGVQNFENGPIQWKRDLPETSPLSSGLKSIVIPMLAGLMEPDPPKMVTYESLFRTIKSIDEKMCISVFHFCRCEDLKIYADVNTTFAGLQDQIASLTDIAARDQILLVGGKSLEDVVDPKRYLKDYPPHLLHDCIYLFQKEISESVRLPKPEIPPFPDFNVSFDMESDARLAHGCAARAELIKRYIERTTKYQERLTSGIFCLKVFVESRLETTKMSQEFMKQLMDECKNHFETLFDMVQILQDIFSSKQKVPQEIEILSAVLQDTVIRQVHVKATDRIGEIEQYRETLLKKLDDINNDASKLTSACVAEKCFKKCQHHMTVISGVASRFRRDKNVKNQMTPHDENIHGYERSKLNEHCIIMKSTLTEHCLPKLDTLHKNSIQFGELLTRCLNRVQKIEKNIGSVLNCQKLLSDKIVKLKKQTHEHVKLRDTGYWSVQDSCVKLMPPELEASGLDSASNSGSSTQELVTRKGKLSSTFDEDVNSFSKQSIALEKKLFDLQKELQLNSSIMQSLDDSSLISRGSLSATALYQSDLGGNT